MAKTLKGIEDYKTVRNDAAPSSSVVSLRHPCHNPGMAVVEEEPEPGAGPAIVIITVIVLIAAIVVLFYGLAVLHWFGFDQPAAVGAAPSVTPTPAASASASAAASTSASP
jgi:hypothetical protein